MGLKDALKKGTEKPDLGKVLDVRLDFIGYALLMQFSGQVFSVMSQVLKQGEDEQPHDYLKRLREATAIEVVNYEECLFNLKTIRMQQRQQELGS